MKNIINSVKEMGKDGKLASEKDIGEFINSNLSSDNAEKLKSVLNDKEKTKKLLESDAAKEILKKFLGGN